MAASIDFYSKLQILDRIQGIKDEFYESTKKNVFFKKSQKQELSNRIIQELSIEQLIAVSMYRLPDVVDIAVNVACYNRIYVDYSIIKMYIDVSVYDKIVDRLFSLLMECCCKPEDSGESSFEIHINLEGFTITSAERHKVVIEQFCQRMDNTKCFELMRIMYIYNTPSMIDAISSLFSYLVHPNIKQKMLKYTKTDSADRIAYLLRGSTSADEI